jgi:crotonobetainyl-CoA:carnitine CoA-transferase CaiB-like acyl-CoA transferase
MKVVELVNGLAPRLLGKYLSDMGWTVATYELNERKPHYSPEDWNTVTLKLQEGKKKIPDVVELARELSSANIVIHDSRNFRDHVPSHVLQRVINVHIPSYASQDSHHSCFCEDEAAVMAASGVFSDMGLNRTLLGIRASFSHLPLASAYGSIFALCALLSEVVQGKTNTYIEIPLASALTEALVHNSIVFPVDDIYLSRRKRCIHKKEFPIDEDSLDSLFDPFFTFYTCRDGRKVYLVCPAHVKHQMRAIEILGVKDEVLSKVKVVNTYQTGGGIGIGSGNLDEAQSLEVRSILKGAFKQRDADTWEGLLGNAEVPAIMVRSTAEWLRHPHVKGSGLIKNGVPSGIFWSHELRRCERRSPVALSHVKVIDMTNVIAGPTISTMLARFGCEVIKVDSPHPLYAPDVTVIYGIPANIGKKSVLLDVKTKEGRRALECLIKTADVMVLNTTMRGLERMGISYDDLGKINPTLIITRFDAWGGPDEGGEFSEFLGYDDNIQASTGIMIRYGGSHDTCEEHAHVGTIDTIAGVCGAASTLYAILKRQQEGIVCEARTSLAAVSQYIQYPFIVAGEPPCVGGLGNRCMGMTPYYCVYRAKDCHLMLTGIANPTVVGSTYDNIKAFMQNKTLKEIEVLLSSTLLNVTRLRDTAELRRMFTVKQQSLSLSSTYEYVECDNHPMGRTIMVSPVAMRLPIKFLSPIAPKYGQHTLNILKSIHMLHTWGGKDSYGRGYIPQTPNCDVCNKKNKSLSVIDCCHKLCDECITITLKGVCPVCSETSNILESIRTQIWRDSYSKWRKGSWHGSTTRTCGPSSHRLFKSVSCPNGLHTACQTMPHLEP